MNTYSNTRLVILTTILVILAVLDRVFTQHLITENLATELNPLAFNGFFFASTIIATVLISKYSKSFFIYRFAIPFESLMILNEFLIVKGVY